MTVSGHLPCLIFLIVAHVPSGRPDVVGHLSRVIPRLNRTANHLSSQVAVMTADLHYKDGQVATLTANLANKAQVIATTRTALDHQTATLTSLDPFCKTHVTDLNTRVGALKQGVGFTARFTNDSVGPLTQHFHGGYVLKFDRLEYQVGGVNYDTSTGRFVAPSSGVYAFFLTIQRSDATGDDCAEAGIVREPQHFVASVSACPTGFSASSSTGLVHLTQGDKVHVRTTHAERLLGYVHTTFSGVKIADH